MCTTSASAKINQRDKGSSPSNLLQSVNSYKDTRYFAATAPLEKVSGWLGTFPDSLTKNILTYFTARDRPVVHLNYNPLLEPSIVLTGPFSLCVKIDSCALSFP